MVPKAPALKGRIEPPLALMMHAQRVCGTIANVQGQSLLTHHHLQGWPGLSQSARDGLVARQPKTVLDALRIPGVGRKTTARLLALGLLLRDPHGVQSRARTAEEAGIRP